ncbi:type IV pilus assembly protein PilM [Cellulomonas citrea]|uniref:type IV pilus assembly protein PilM n=1 Tax=Cellulomonas citrea TaxID=1909423 RepID=UPI00135AF981|nr:type IV pilus assembly protein PilM [Cellulomonas citrea]
MGATRVIGLDIGTTTLRAVELQFGNGGPGATAHPALLHHAQTQLPPGAVRDGEVVEASIVAGALKELWARGHFTSKDVVLGVGNQRVLVRDLEMPWIPPADRRTALPFHVADALPMPLDDAILDFLPTFEGDDGAGGHVMRGMLVAAQRRTVETNVEAAEAAGLRPVMVDLNGFALTRAVSHDELADQVVAIVDFGASGTTVVIADRGTPRLVRMLPMGGQAITSTLASTLQVSPAQAEAIKQEQGMLSENGPARDTLAGMVRQLIESVRNTFVYYQGNHPGAGIATTVVTGGGVALPGLGQYLASATRVPVVLGDPLARLRPEKHVDGAALRARSASLALSIGLAHGAAA